MQTRGRKTFRFKKQQQFYDTTEQEIQEQTEFEHKTKRVSAKELRIGKKESSHGGADHFLEESKQKNFQKTNVARHVNREAHLHVNPKKMSKNTLSKIKKYKT